MRNLRITGRSLLRFSGEDPLPLTATAWDVTSNALVCAFGPTESRATIEIKKLHVFHDDNGSQERLESVASWDAPCPLPSLTHDSIINLHHFSDSSTSCLVLAGGDIILVRQYPENGEELVEIVGSVDAGISAAAWSPDEELLSITTMADTLLLMSRDIENIASITLSPDDVNASNHVSVGWGKKETQFKGKRARALQDPTMPETVDEGVLSPLDDRSVTISWRGDGAYFAVNKVEQERRRMIRVYSREGQLDSVSEPVDGLEGALSWRPSGNLIAGIQRLNDRMEVIFFERNGLRHGQFDLRFTPEELQTLSTPLTLRWNSDSNVLAIAYQDKVQFWTMSNYHYYLKQEIALPDRTAGNVLSTWHPEQPLLVALSTTDALQVAEYTSIVASGSVVPPHDFGVVASIDGLSLKLTPLRIANVPPPMSLQQLALDHKPTDVAFSVTGKLMAVLSDKHLAMYAVDLERRPLPVPTLIWQSKEFVDTSPRQVTFIDHDRVCVLTDSWSEEESSIWVSEGEELLPRGLILEPQMVSSLTHSVDFGKLYAASREGTVYEVLLNEAVEDLPLPTSLVTKLPSFAPEVKVAVVEEQVCSKAQTGDQANNSSLSYSV